MGTKPVDNVSLYYLPQFFSLGSCHEFPSWLPSWGKISYKAKINLLITKLLLVMTINPSNKNKLRHHKYDIKSEELYIHLKCLGLKYTSLREISNYEFVAFQTMQMKVIIFYYIERKEVVNICALSCRTREGYNFQILSIMSSQD